MNLQNLFYQVKEQNTEEYTELLFNLYEDTAAYTVEAVFDDDALMIGRDNPAVICENHGDFLSALRVFEQALRSFCNQYQSEFDNLKIISYGFVDGDLAYIKGDENSCNGEVQQPLDKTDGKEKLKQLKSWEPTKKAADMRTVTIFLVTLVFTVGLIACLYFLYLYNRDTAAGKQGHGVTQQENRGETQQENHVDPADQENEELPEPTTAVPDAVTDSYQLRYFGMDTGVEILLKDCVCEYDKDSTQVYACFVDDAAVEVKGYAIYIRTPEDVMQIFPVKDYRMDESAGRLYMLWGNKAFERIQGVHFLNGINSYKIESTYLMEDLIGDAYGLELFYNEEDFEDLQVDFTGLYQEDGKTLLRGKASALYRITGKRYSIDWEIDTESLRKSAKAYLADLDIHPLYAAFLRGEISVANPYVAEGASNTELSFSDDRDYEDEHFTFHKSFALVDVSGDGNPELVFQMTDSPSKLMYILGVYNGELICFDVFETHTSRMGFGVYDNGVVYDYNEEQELYCTYTDDGKARELIHFVAEEDGRISYYLEGNIDAKIGLQNYEEYENFLSSYWEDEPGWPEWRDCDMFADIL